MADRRVAWAVWACAAVLLLLVGLSLRGDGTWMGGFGMGWMMAVPLLVLGLAIWFAYRYGRLEEKVEGLEREKGRKP